MRGPMQDVGAGPHCYDVITTSQPCYNLFNEDFYQNGLYEYEKRRKKHAAVVDIRQCNKPKVVKETLQWRCERKCKVTSIKAN